MCLCVSVYMMPMVRWTSEDIFHDLTLSFHSVGGQTWANRFAGWCFNLLRHCSSLKTVSVIWTMKSYVNICFWDRNSSLCSLSWLWTHRDPLLSPYLVLRWKMCQNVWQYFFSPLKIDVYPKNMKNNKNMKEEEEEKKEKEEKDPFFGSFFILSSVVSWDSRLNTS